MKPINVALFSVAGMALASIAVYSTPWLGAGQRSAATSEAAATASSGPAVAAPSSTAAAPEEEGDLARFSAGGAIKLEGRIGHAKLPQGAEGETYLLLEATSATDARGSVAAPSNLSLVIDRSGSMKGNRLKNAIKAAIAAVNSLGDGDVVSVVAFDTAPTVVVPSTVIDPLARASVVSAIGSIAIGGDTCISCGIEEGTRQIQRVSGKVNRMIVLSDGDANHGARDVPAFQKIAEDERSAGISVTTIGVDLTYNQKILAALAQASGGRHYFVEDDAALARVFQSEAETLRTTVASDAEASIELKDGVELARVFDRPFRREGNRIIVSLGSFAPGDAKTILVQVRVKAPEGAGDSIPIPVASVDLKYRDLAAGKEAKCDGDLGVRFVKDAGSASELDGLVQRRLSRSETAAALLRANELFEQGKADEAQRVLDEHRKTIEGEAAVASKSAPSQRKGELDADYKGQAAALSSASASYGASAKTKDDAAGRRAVRNTQMVLNPYMD